MIKVYGSVLSRASMVMVALESLGLEYELVEIATAGADSRGDEYRSLNPTGKVPTLVDGDLVLFETQAILFYLARKYGNGKLWADTVEGEAEIMKWTLFISNQLEVAALDMLIQFKFAKDNPDVEIMERASGVLNQFLPVLEQQLEGKDYLVGHKTIADIHGGMVLNWPKLAGFDYADYPNLNAWTQRVNASPENKRVYAQAKR